MFYIFLRQFFPSHEYTATFHLGFLSSALLSLLKFSISYCPPLHAIPALLSGQFAPVIHKCITLKMYINSNQMFGYSLVILECYPQMSSMFYILEQCNHLDLEVYCNSVFILSFFPTEFYCIYLDFLFYIALVSVSCRHYIWNFPQNHYFSSFSTILFN